MSSGGNFIPLFWALGLIFGLGVLIPLIISSVLDMPVFLNTQNINIPNETAQNISFSTSFTTQVSTIRTQVGYYLGFFNYIPAIILNPLIIILGIALIYGIWKALSPL